MPAEREDARGTGGRHPRPVVKRRELLGLILATYKTAFPYFLVIVLGLLILTWFLSEVAFVR